MFDGQLKNGTWHAYLPGKCKTMDIHSVSIYLLILSTTALVGYGYGTLIHVLTSRLPLVSRHARGLCVYFGFVGLYFLGCVANYFALQSSAMFSNNSSSDQFVLFIALIVWSITCFMAYIVREEFDQRAAVNLYS